MAFEGTSSDQDTVLDLMNDLRRTSALLIEELEAPRLARVLGPGVHVARRNVRVAMKELDDRIGKLSELE